MHDDTIQKIFQSGYTEFESDHPLPKHFRDAAHALTTCRTAALGGHTQSCPDKHFSRMVQLMQTPPLSAMCLSTDSKVA